jgi:hypothetical protein
MSWRTQRAKEVWASILDGDCAQYQQTSWKDIPKGSMEIIEGDWSDYDVETLINQTFLENGYEWAPDPDDPDDLGLVKKR